MKAVLNCFGTIRNNTALKLIDALPQLIEGFGTIRNNTALKQKPIKLQTL
ncbi:hypothetical protein HMPREF9382_0585 [Streptococcus sanguinis SK115]|uniref:Uncharacterized protein n=1 Tax=Streptococcus sanguinis SK115 TaxID=888810 RepID=F0I702_STRSA|nr:hypothetical protein HMPREF9382_0585 [Streptococcus sanguinis SK115]